MTEPQSDGLTARAVERMVQRGVRDAICGLRVAVADDRWDTAPEDAGARFVRALRTLEGTLWAQAMIEPDTPIKRRRRAT